MAKLFEQMQLQAIADALGDTEAGLTGSEIGHLLRVAKISDVTSEMTKRHRLFNAFAESQNKRQDRVCILAFVRFAMKPERYVRTPERYEPLRANLNRALAFCVSLFKKAASSLLLKKLKLSPKLSGGPLNFAVTWSLEIFTRMSCDFAERSC